MGGAIVWDGNFLLAVDGSGWVLIYFPVYRSPGPEEASSGTVARTGHTTEVLDSELYKVTGQSMGFLSQHDAVRTKSEMGVDQLCGLCQRQGYVMGKSSFLLFLTT